MHRLAAVGVITAAAASLLPVGATAASASTDVQHGNQTQVDDNPNSMNPCNGDLGDLVDIERDNWTVVTRSDGSSLARGHSVADIVFTPYATTEATYYGHEEFSSSEHFTHGADGFTTQHHLHVRGTDGRTILITETAHMTATPDGTVRVDRQQQSLSCE
jgi:hypothetical protein